MTQDARLSDLFASGPVADFALVMDIHRQTWTTPAREPPALDNDTLSRLWGSLQYAAEVLVGFRRAGWVEDEGAVLIADLDRAQRHAAALLSLFVPVDAQNGPLRVRSAGMALALLVPAMGATSSPEDVSRVLQDLPVLLASAAQAVQEMRSSRRLRMTRTASGQAPARPLLLTLLRFAYRAAYDRLPGGSDSAARDTDAPSPFGRFARAVAETWPRIAGSPEALSLLRMSTLQLTREGRQPP